MSISVNGVEVAVAPQTTSEFAAARELLRQRAIAIGVLAPDATDETEIESGLEELFTREVSTPEPTKEECQRYYETHPQGFRSGDLVHVRHILFQVTPTVPVPEIRARAEQTLNGLKLLEVPADLIETAIALELQEKALTKDRIDDRDCVFLAGLEALGIGARP